MFFGTPCILNVFSGVKYFHTVLFPSEDFLSGNFQNVQFPSCDFPKVRLGLLRRRKRLWDRTLWLELTRNYTLILRQTWEVAAWLVKCTVGKLPLGKRPSGKYLPLYMLPIASISPLPSASICLKALQ